MRKSDKSPTLNWLKGKWGIVTSWRTERIDAEVQSNERFQSANGVRHFGQGIFRDIQYLRRENVNYWLGRFSFHEKRITFKSTRIENENFIVPVNGWERPTREVRGQSHYQRAKVLWDRGNEKVDEANQLFDCSRVEGFLMFFRGWKLQLEHRSSSNAHNPTLERHLLRVSSSTSTFSSIRKKS